jgi:hypothetical protein
MVTTLMILGLVIFFGSAVFGVINMMLRFKSEANGFWNRHVAAIIGLLTGSSIFAIGAVISIGQTVKLILH